MADNAAATFEVDIEIKCPREKFFNVRVDFVTLLPQVLSHTFKSATEVKGDGKSVDSVVDQQYVTLGMHCIIFEFCLITNPPNFDTARQTIEAVDEENMLRAKRFYSGDVGKKFHLYGATVKAFKKGDKNSVKWTLETKKTHDEILDPHNYLAFIEKFTKEFNSALTSA